MNTNKWVAAPPSVADYFEQKLGVKLPPAHPGETELDSEHPASPAHPEFHIHTPCGLDCKLVIDTAALILMNLADPRLVDHEAAVIHAAALLTFVRDAIPSEEVLSKARAVYEVARCESFASESTALDVQHIAAEVINVYVYS